MSFHDASSTDHGRTKNQEIVLRKQCPKHEPLCPTPLHHQHSYHDCNRKHKKGDEYILYRNPRIQPFVEFIHETLNFLPCKLHLSAKHCCEYHFDILPEGVMAIVIAVEANLIRVYHLVIIFSSNHLNRASITLCLFLCHILRNHFILQAILQRSRTRDPRTKLQNIPIISFQFISITRNIRTGTHETHIANQHIPKLRQLINFIMAKLRTKRSDSAITRHRYRRTIMTHHHRAELMALKQFSPLAHSLLNKESRATRHLLMNKKSHQREYPPYQEQSKKGCYNIK